MSIVVGYLPTPEGEAALQAAIDEARRRDERLTVVISSATRAGTDSMNEAVDGLHARLEDLELVHEIRQVARGGDVSEDLVETATEVRASMLVIGLRRPGLRGKLFLGSKAQRILLDAPCPVLAVKGGTPV